MNCLKAPKIVNVVLGAFVVVLAALPAAAGGELAGLAAGDIDAAPYAVAVRESGGDRRRAIEIDAAGAWRRSESRPVCRETWEARCWRETVTRGAFTAAEKARWVRAAARLAAGPAAEPPPGAAMVSVAVRRGAALVGEATAPADAQLGALWGK